MLSSRALRWVLLGAGLAVLAFGAWSAYQVWQVNRDLADAVGHAESIQRAVEARDTDGLASELDALRESSGAAADRTSGFTWSVLTKVPVFGDDAAAVELTSDVVHDLAQDGIEPLVTVSDRFDDLLPKDGRIDVSVVEELAAPIARASAAFEAADERLADEDPDDYVGPLATKFASLQDKVDRASGALGSAKAATAVLPGMLGGNGPRHYLLVFQNNAEVRATGGLPGAISSVRSSNGKLAIDKHVTADSFGEADAPVLKLSKAERRLYGDVLGTYVQDANMTPDVPRAADLIRARWKQRFPGDRIDGVLMIDAVAISYLLHATGPITAGGVELTGDNVVDELLHRAYLRIPDPKRQDLFFAAVAAKTFDKFTQGVQDPAGLLRALARATGERRVALHSFHDKEQAEISGSAIAGELVTDPAEPEPQINVTMNDTTAGKMSYFLRYDVDVSARSCRGGVQHYDASATLRSAAPADARNLPDYITADGIFGVEPGSQIVTVRIFAPVGGSVTDLTVNGVESDLESVDQDGRPVGTTYIQLDPGQEVSLHWRMDAGKGQDGDTAVVVTPPVEAKDTVQVVGTVCTNSNGD